LSSCYAGGFGRRAKRARAGRVREIDARF